MSLKTFIGLVIMMVVAFILVTIITVMISLHQAKKCQEKENHHQNVK
ncbi:hypothetical protein [Fructilactobacillus fructivorans]|nr:hypothetical protein [Fructilactobacillus fructivorans]